MTTIEIIKLVGSGSGWLILAFNYFTSKSNKKKEFKDKIYEYLDKLVELSKNNDSSDVDYYYVRDKIMDLIGDYKVRHNDTITLSDILENIIYKLKIKNDIRDDRKKFIQIINDVF